MCLSSQNKFPLAFHNSSLYYADIKENVTLTYIIIQFENKYYTHTHTLRCYLLLERQAILLLKAFALAEQVALLCEDGGGGGHLVGGAALAATAPHSPHLLLVTANAVRTCTGNRHVPHISTHPIKYSAP